jgi:5-methylcytosine-specific restriction endonuclease McrA
MWLVGRIPARTFAQRHFKTLKQVQKELRATREHLLPRSHGGGSDHNIVAACRECNNERGNKLFSKKPLPHVAMHLPLEVQFYITSLLNPEQQRKRK